MQMLTRLTNSFSSSSQPEPSGSHGRTGGAVPMSAASLSTRDLPLSVPTLPCRRTCLEDPVPTASSSTINTRMAGAALRTAAIACRQCHGESPTSRCTPTHQQAFCIAADSSLTVSRCPGQGLGCVFTPCGIPILLSGAASRGEDVFGTVHSLTASATEIADPCCCRLLAMAAPVSRVHCCWVWDW